MRALILAIISGVKAASPSLSRLARKYSSKGSSQGKRDGDEERDDNADREDGERETLLAARKTINSATV